MNAEGREDPGGEGLFFGSCQGAKEGEQLRKEVKFQEFMLEKLITMDWEVKKMRKENEGLQKEVAGLRKEVAEMHGWMGEVVKWMKNQVEDLVSEAGGMKVEEESESSMELDMEMVSAVDKGKGVERVLEEEEVSELS